MEDNIFCRQKLQYSKKKKKKKKNYRNKNLRSKTSLQQQQKKCRKLFLHKQKYAVSNFFFTKNCRRKKNEIIIYRSK